MLHKKFNDRKQDIWFQNHNLMRNHENYDSDDEKKFKIFQCNPNDPNFDLFKFLGEINLHISKLHEKNTVNKVINKIAEDFEKIVVETKLNELKRYAKNILPKYKK